LLAKNKSEVNLEIYNTEGRWLFAKLIA